MKLYDLKTGMNPRRLRIFLAEKGVSLPMVQVDMSKGENRTPEFLSKNPMGTMPVLELDDGTILTESVAICRYIEELHPSPNLMGANTLERAQIEMWNRRMELEVMLPLTQHFLQCSEFWKGRFQQFPDYGKASQALGLKRMAWLDTELASRAFVAGDRYTIADITLQCALLLAKNTGTPVPAELTNLTRWFATVSARPTARA